MKLTLMLWTAAAAAAVTMQLLAAASLEMEEKELEDAQAPREVEVEVEVERRGGQREVQQQMILLDAMGDAFQTLLRLAKRLSRRGKGRRRGRGRKIQENYVYDNMPFKRNLKEEEEKRCLFDCMPRKKWRGKGRRQGNGRKFKEYYVYDDMPFKRLLEGQGGKAQESVAQEDAMALCRDFLKSQKIGEAAGKAESENKEQGEGKQEEIQEEGKQDDSQEDMVDWRDLVQTEKMLELCLELIP